MEALVFGLVKLRSAPIPPSARTAPYKKRLDAHAERQQAKITLADLGARARALVASIQAASAVEEQRVASEATWEVSRSRLRKAAEASAQACSSDKLAGILEAETDGFRKRRESETTLQVRTFVGLVIKQGTNAIRVHSEDGGCVCVCVWIVRYCRPTPGEVGVQPERVSKPAGTFMRVLS